MAQKTLIGPSQVVTTSVRVISCSSALMASATSIVVGSPPFHIGRRVDFASADSAKGTSCLRVTAQSFAAVFGFIVILIGLIGLYYYVSTPSSDRVIEEGRLRRRQTELERQLDYLASIRRADLGTLIEERRNPEVG